MISAPALRSNGVEIDYRVIFDAVPGLYMLIDPALNIVTVNDAYAKATLIDKAAVAGRPLFEVFPDNPDDPDADGVRNLHASLRRVLKDGKPDVMAVQKYDIRLPDGSFTERHWAPMNTPVLDDDGRIALIIHMAEDVTQVVRLNSEMAERQQAADDSQRMLGEMRTLNSMLATTLKENRKHVTERQQAQERLTALQAELIHLSRWNTMGMMASTIAHELNQPLTAMVNYVRAATRTLKSRSPEDQGGNTDRVTALLDKAVEETKLAGNIIRSLREFIDKRGAGRQMENINVLVEEAISLSLLGPARDKITTIIELDQSLPPILVDKVQIQQVLLNLIRNAMEAMEGSAQGQIMIATSLDAPGFIGVSVTDNGPGLPPEIAARLFQPFTTTKDKGMGIGLTICQSIIESHGGGIAAQPVAPKGVSFRFRLPITTEGGDA